MTNPFSDVERLAIHTTDGLGLRAEFRDGGAEPGGPARALAVICHPHPLHGGNMHNHVVGGLFTALPDVGVPTMRFNFRGTSGSEGRHGGGIAERLDVVAAIDALTSRYGHDAGVPPLALIGYSFGALVALAVDHPVIGGWMAIAPPLTMIDEDGLAAADDSRPTVIVAGTADDFCPVADAERLTARWSATRVVALSGEDHFLTAASQRLAGEAEDLVNELAGG